MYESLLFYKDTLVRFDADDLMEPTCLIGNLCLLGQVREAVLVDGRRLDAGILS